MKLLYEGKAKRLYETEHPEELRMEFKDDATAFNGEKKAQFEDKGRMNREISSLLYELLDVPTHHLRDIDDTNVIVRRVEIIPLEMVARNIVAGSLAKRTGLPEGHALKAPIVETYYKDDDLGDPILADVHVLAMELCSEAELAELKDLTLRVNGSLRDFFAGIGITLVDFKLEFGRTSDGSILLADEISPDTCRLWDATTGEKMDKDRFRRDLGDVMGGYAQVLQRIRDAVQG